ncbi:unnamed protein product [Closterium sp. NIES-54]
MVSALQDKGVNLLEEFLFDHAVQAPWEEDPRLRTDQSPEQLAMQIVRELLLHRMHQVGWAVRGLLAHSLARYRLWSVCEGI